MKENLPILLIFGEFGDYHTLFCYGYIIKTGSIVSLPVFRKQFIPSGSFLYNLI
jgi:hypothetical protein